MAGPRGLVLAAPHGRSGKTTVAMGVCAALAGRGLRVQPFKKGPDFIDPGWLTLAAGRSCRNLDLFMLGDEVTRRSFLGACRGADLALVEGAMGLFDGLDPAGSNSTAQLARLLGLPVVLLVDVTRMTRTAAAVVRGLVGFEEGIDFRGVILNRVGTSRQERLVRQAVEQYSGLPVLGAIPRWQGAAVPDRHLGLIPAGERLSGTRLAAEEAIAEAARAVQAGVDLDRLLEAGAPIAAPYHADGGEGFAGERSGREEEEPVSIGVVRDRVFSFYYPDNLEALERAGARLVPIDSLQDSRLPLVAALYIGGGFPEVFAHELEQNLPLRLSLREAIAEGLPVYAECGGLMYLCRSIAWEGQGHEMVGALPFDVEMATSPRGHGYVEAEVVGENPYFPRGAVIRGHEFHHSLPTRVPAENMVFRLGRGTGWGHGCDGLMWGSVFASYLHVHALACPGWAPALVREARRFDRERRGVRTWR
ncbi:MAG: hydrogenobyrinic acid a,c-diamide synthase (glutamine-hydrolyzing) [Bacillota bacterium]|nr:hydrogenobyrinic acid a,c-diamide synthase (glutamine-hydrolyzing) [Bacillota bacterium]